MNRLRRRAFLESAISGIWALAVADALDVALLAQPAPRRYTGFIVVRLRPERFGNLLLSASDLRALAQQANATDLTALLDRYPGLSTRRLISGLTSTQVVEREKRAAERGATPRWSLNTYWRVDARTVDNRPQLVQLLGTMPDVDVAYEQPKGADPSVDPSNDQFAAQQFHLGAAPMGVDAHWAWMQAGGAGEGVAFVDVEQGWIFNHEDLPGFKVLPNVSWEVTTGSRPHGTAVVSLAAGLDNVVGIVGVAPKPDWVSVSSHVRQGVADQVSDAIANAANSMKPGDVLLVEWTDPDDLPAEIVPDVFTAISDATGNGIIVIECAGNSNKSLDGITAIDRRNANTDSGAIIVGAAHRALDSAGAGHNRLQFASFAGSNFGARVDCYAIGEQLVAAGPAKSTSGSLTPVGTPETMAYRKDFAMTSGSGPIVAGAAMALQGMHKALKGVPLTPAEMRMALSTHGTPQGIDTPGHIGVMPDLRKAALALGLVAGSSSSRPSPPTNIRIAP
jgi:hypothetical protein